MNNQKGKNKFKGGQTYCEDINLQDLVDVFVTELIKLSEITNGPNNNN